MLDLFVIGDVTTDHIISVDEKEIVNSIDRIKAEVTLPFSSKVPLSSPPQVTPGGNAYTVSIACSKLEMQSAIYTVIGPDPEGQTILRKLRSFKVDCKSVEKDINGTNSSTILSLGGDRIVFSYHFDRIYGLKQIPDCQWVYLTSMGEDDYPVFKTVLEEKARLGFKLVFAPGSRQLREDYSEISQIMSHCDFLILNKEEAQQLLKTDSVHDAELLRGLQKLGAAQVVITKSWQGAVATSGNQILQVGALRMPVKDTTGAGDTFAATVMAAIHHNLDLQTALEMAAINAAHVVCQVGCENGMLAWEVLTAKHEELKGQLEFVD